MTGWEPVQVSKIAEQAPAGSTTTTQDELSAHVGPAWVRTAAVLAR